MVQDALLSSYALHPVAHNQTEKFMATQQLTREVSDGTVYLTTEYRGTAYTLRRSQWGWELTTKRIALGRWNAGGFKRFATLADVQVGCKAFAGLQLANAL